MLVFVLFLFAFSQCFAISENIYCSQQLLKALSEDCSGLGVPDNALEGCVMSDHLSSFIRVYIQILFNQTIELPS